ncbi:rhodanese-like domain-containing protein [Methanoregula sp.]|uniref:MBL fold metallo-hydrolase n=1 Tax=Methanoregula sp. TaxID=2052170 RepID=UPI000CAFC123|nr:MBL fold metallo-hydrolase [Methanoregula sp.]PKG33141.1 MAG: MBL fold metallo-hydrolase [Methanoregula sp.]
MLFHQVVSEGLAHYSYLIASGTEAAVIDPRRDCDIYLQIAHNNGLSIRHIFETHRNEDYVTGSTALREACGAEIWHGRQMDFAFGKPVQEGDRFTIGSLEIMVLETPGHTEESISLVVRDLAVTPDPFMVFCGDTLFAGEIGRTDFYGPDRNVEMAGKIFDSITRKILTLGDGVIICPAHGPGSICGGTIAEHPFTTAGYERQSNPRLKMGRDAFIAHRVTESPYTPHYFRRMETWNRNGPPRTPADLFPRPLSAEALETAIRDGCQVVDIRSPTSFAGGHIRGSISLWRRGISGYAGFVLDYEKPVALVDDFNTGIDEVARQFSRMGFDSITGILSGGFGSWASAGKEIALLPSCTAPQLAERLKREPEFLLDVRHGETWRSYGHIPGAHHIYAGEVLQHLDKIPKDRTVITYCDAGFKGSLAASLLSRNGYRDVTNLLGGIAAWTQAGFETGP